MELNVLIVADVNEGPVEPDTTKGETLPDVVETDCEPLVVAFMNVELADESVDIVGVEAKFVPVNELAEGTESDTSVLDKPENEDEGKFEILVLEEEDTVPAGTDVLALTFMRALVLVDEETIKTVLELSRLAPLDDDPAGITVDELARILTDDTDDDDARFDIPADGLDMTGGVDIAWTGVEETPAAEDESFALDSGWADVGMLDVGVDFVAMPPPATELDASEGTTLELDGN